MMADACISCNIQQLLELFEGVCREPFMMIRGAEVKSPFRRDTAEDTCRVSGSDLSALLLFEATERSEVQGEGLMCLRLGTLGRQHPTCTCCGRHRPEMIHHLEPSPCGSVRNPSTGRSECFKCSTLHHIHRPQSDQLLHRVLRDRIKGGV